MTIQPFEAARCDFRVLVENALARLERAPIGAKTDSFSWPIETACKRLYKRLYRDLQNGIY